MRAGGLRGVMIRGARSGRRWSDADKARLAALFPHFSTKTIARMMRRTVGAIIAQAHVQGLRRPPGWTDPAKKRRSRGGYGPLIRREAPLVGSTEHARAG